ncbi:MAG TPA: OmpA family protein [Rhizomicrobium sp.]|nr:OmpA family protein [Rhizomicrobium sp.]
MKLVLGFYSKTFARIAAMLVVGAALSACSSVPDWVDPTTWVGSDDSANASELPADQSADADQSGESSDQPDLASIPDRPEASSTEGDRQQVADSLSADRARTQYSGENLRGDGTASSAPPPAAPTPDAAQAPANSIASADEDNAQSPAPAPAARSRQVASAEMPVRSRVPTTSSSGPAVPAGTAVGAAPNSDAALGFQPSHAPPLDASVAQFVPQPIISRYRQTAAVGSTAGVRAPAVPAGPSEGAMGGPEAMSGAVVANLDVLGPAAAQPAAYANPAGLPPAAVVFFPHDTTVLNAQGRAQVHAALEAYRSRGGQGYIKVVGHSSSRTANMTLQRHLVFNFERSQARATAVAKELIREGVPANKVLVEAVGDSQPVYYESMPQGEEGNRRAEIFIQG